MKTKREKIKGKNRNEKIARKGRESRENDKARIRKRKKINGKEKRGKESTRQ